MKTTREESDLLLLEARFIYESNMIEGITIPLNQILKELGMRSLAGHVGALLAANLDVWVKQPVTEKMICNWQALIVREQNSLNLHPENIISGRYIGQYRDCGESVGNKRCMPPQAVPVCMKQLVEEINHFQKNNEALPPNKIIEKIADFHLDFLTIHPFVDGNGRTSRILVWYLFRYLGLVPFIFTSHDKWETYYKAFNGMREYFLGRI